MVQVLMCVSSGLAQTEDQNVILATVNGQNITQAEVDLSVMGQIMPLKQQIHALRKSALENLITRALLEAEAKKRSITVDELKKQLTSGVISVSASQVEDVYRENVLAFGVMSPDEAKERIRLDLESQARMQNYRSALSQLKEAAKIRVLLTEPRVSVSDNTTSPFLGPKDAAITITEFSDFQCPYCREASGAIKQVLNAYGDKVRVVFRHLPLAIHTQAFPAARAAYCAGQENRFWQFHDQLFAAEDLSDDTISKIVGDLGLNRERFNSCLKSESSRIAVVKDLQEASKLGINSTPTFLINGRLVRGTIKFEAFKEIIDHELTARTSENNPVQ
jgi:protein-disulfide isomerase